MENWQKIEIIVTTVAAYYGVRWQDMWRISRRRVNIRANMLKLIRDHAGVYRLDQAALVDITYFSKNIVRHNLMSLDDRDYEILNNKIGNQLTIKQAS